METFRADDYHNAQRLPVTDQATREGFVDPPALDAMCRFAFLGNLTGLPAGTAPVGFDGERMPVGLQIVGDAWDEASVLAVLAHMERIGQAKVSRLASFVNLLGDFGAPAAELAVQAQGACVVLAEADAAIDDPYRVASGIGLNAPFTAAHECRDRQPRAPRNAGPLPALHRSPPARRARVSRGPRSILPESALRERRDCVGIAFAAVALGNLHVLGLKNGLHGHADSRARRGPAPRRYGCWQPVPPSTATHWPLTQAVPALHAVEQSPQ